MTGYVGESFGLPNTDGFIEGMDRHNGESFTSISRLSANIAPVVTISAPAGTPVAQDEVVRVDTSDELPSTVQVLQISIEFDNGLKETVYDTIYGFGPGYQGALNQVTDISDDEVDAVRVEFNRDAGWADAGATVRAISVDVDGNVTDETEDLTFDVAATTVSVTAPAGSPVESDEVVRADTTRSDPGVVVRVEVDIEFGNGLREVVWDGDEFGPAYQGASNQQTSITDGFRTEFNRDAGWPDADGTVHVAVTDEQGVVEEADQALTFDVSASVIAITAPGGEPVATDEVIRVEATQDPNGVTRVEVDVEYTDGTREVVWDGDAFGPGYQGASNQTTPITDGYRVEFNRDGGWLKDGATVHVVAVDSFGGVTEDDDSFDLEVGTTTIAISAPGGEPIATGEVVRVDVTRNAGTVDRYAVDAEYTGGDREVVWDGDSFGPAYQSGPNTEGAVTGGRRLEFTRDGGWPEDEVTVSVVAYDSLGSVTEGSDVLDLEAAEEDTSPAAITFDTPDSPVATDDPVTVTIEDPNILHAVISVQLPLSGIHEIAYLDGVFGPRYQGGANGVETTIGGGIIVTLQRVGGWPERAVKINVTAVDEDVV